MRLFLLGIVLGYATFVGPSAFAQETSDAATADSQSQAPKPPPPPLFPRHGRGIYRNTAGEDVVDATPQSPPLATDDPGVPSRGEYEINLLTLVDHTHATQRLDVLVVDVNYGLGIALRGHELPTQLKFEVPLAATRHAGEPLDIDVGTAALGAKFNVYDDQHRGTSVSVYPQLEFSTAGGRGVAKGLSEKGQTLLLPVLIAREFHTCTMVVNAGVQAPLHDPTREATSELGVALGRALTRKDATMIELRTESSLNFRREQLVFMNFGFIHGVRNIVMYANVGRSIFADDDATHTYGGIGVKVQIRTRRSSPNR